jgi:hypothetical protein
VAVRLIKAVWTALACGPGQPGERARRRVGLDLESGQDTHRVGDDRWSPPVIDRRYGRRRSGLAATAAGPAGPGAWLGREARDAGLLRRRSGSRPASSCRLN